MNKRSYVIRHVLILRIFGAPKKLHFWQNRKEVLNRLNFASKLSCTSTTCRGHGVMSRAGVMYRGHVEGSRTGSMRVAKGDLHLRIGGVIIVQTL